MLPHTKTTENPARNQNLNSASLQSSVHPLTHHRHSIDTLSSSSSLGWHFYAARSANLVTRLTFSKLLGRHPATRLANLRHSIDTYPQLLVRHPATRLAPRYSVGIFTLLGRHHTHHHRHSIDTLSSSSSLGWHFYAARSANLVTRLTFSKLLGRHPATRLANLRHSIDTYPRYSVGTPLLGWHFHAARSASHTSSSSLGWHPRHSVDIFTLLGRQTSSLGWHLSCSFGTLVTRLTFPRCSVGNPVTRLTSFSCSHGISFPSCEDEEEHHQPTQAAVFP